MLAMKLKIMGGFYIFLLLFGVHVMQSFRNHITSNRTFRNEVVVAMFFPFHMTWLIC